MHVERIDTEQARGRLRRHPERHVHALWSLDTSRHTESVAYKCLRQTIVIYNGLAFPVLFAIADPPEPQMQQLISVCAEQRPLPDQFYGHLSPSALAALQDHYRVDRYSRLLTMTTTASVDIDCRQVIDVGLEHAADVTGLLLQAYPSNRFHPAMMTMGPHVGVRNDGRLVAIAGTQAWSTDQRVAVIGNIATHPDYRRRGLAQQVTAALHRRLESTVDIVSLTVPADNAPAIRLYRRLGYATAAEVIGAVCTRRPA